MYSSGARSRRRGRLGERQAVRHVAEQRVVRRRLIGEHVRRDAARDERGQDVGGVGFEADRPGDAAPAVVGGARQRVVERRRRFVEVARRQPALDPRRIDLDDERHALVHRDRQRLGAAHAAEAGGHGERAAQRAAEMAPGDRGQRLVGALQDALRADVNPRSGRHLAVHRQAAVFEIAEVLPSRPRPAPAARWR